MTETYTNESNSKSQILKSTAIFGSAQVMVIIMSAIRTKILALLLGPVGVGISGLYQSALDLVKTGTGLGLGYSGVKDIAEASATGNHKKISTVLLVLKRWSWLIGLSGLLLTIVLSKQISQLTFGDEKHATDFSLLSVTLLLASLVTYRSAMLQGLRRISDMAKSVVWTSVCSLIITSFIYYVFGIKGIVWAIVSIAGIELVVTWFFSRNTITQRARLSISKSFSEGKAMVRLGFFMTVSLLASTGSMYLVRSFILRQNGLDSVGYFIAAWTISTLYLSAVFNAMGADYFPRLSNIQNDSDALRKVVNDQTEVALLLTMPIIIAMISFIDWLVPLFYSRTFNVTASILNWQLVGDFFKVLSWPLGFVLLAKGKGVMFLASEIIWNLIFCSLVYFGWVKGGIEITGVAFLIAYLIYAVILYVMTNRLIQFQWSIQVWKVTGVLLPLLLLSFLNVKFINSGSKYLFGSLFTLISAIYSYKQLQNLIDFKKILNRLRMKNVL